MTPPNMTHILKPLDLMGKGYVKIFAYEKFNT